VLERAATTGHAVQALRDKNLAVLCENPECPGFDSFRRAAAALGARVTHIRPSEALTTSTHGSDAVGNLLGRLYDAIDCHGVAPEVIDWLARTSGKPVFNELGCRGGTPAPRDPIPEFTLQALLVTALA
jgi:ornithine carbamoyltransferase